MKTQNTATVSPRQSHWGKHPFVKNVGLIMLFLALGIQLFSRDAPITTIANIGLCQAGTVTVPVTAVNFSNITSISLRIEYDPTVMTYSANVPNAQLNTMIVNDVHISADLHKIMIVWGETTPRTFANGSALVTLSFSYIGGTTALTFNNTSNGGGDCEYADENGDPMYDTPTATYYVNSIVQTVPLQNSLTNITVGNGQSATYKATQTVITAGNGSFFVVQSGGSGIIVSGQHIQLFPGTVVQSGGYLHTLISDPCTYPNIPQNLLGSNINLVGLSKEMPTQNVSMASRFTVFPNPTNDKFNLEFADQTQADKVTVEVYGICGEKVLTKELIGQYKDEFTLADSPVGIYFVRVISGDKVETVKIIKQ